ncbi:MAG: sulfite exporter TauE/SafE family protein [Pirellulaceae bacterium]|nr:sulfite exporter TauE/SafE family protein [Pirellulaceae bacterium]
MNWIELLAATLSASLIGSLHCVGMCGPFAIMATTRPVDSKESTFSRIAGYHFGRLTTYVILGTIAGIAGTMLNMAGGSLGLSHSAARLVGASLVILGIVRFASMLRLHTRVVSHSIFLQRWTKSILAIGRWMQPTSPVHRAYVVGLITTWLPCGWLYLFALAASGTGSVFAANMLMVAFWFGTLPLLSVVAVGSQSLRNRLASTGAAFSPLQILLSKLTVQGLAATLMIVFGVYTFYHRSQIQLDSLTETHRSGVLTRSSIQGLADQPLPCCSQSLPDSQSTTQGSP